MDNFEDLEPKPHTTTITAIVEKSEKRVRLSKNKKKEVFMSWKCSHKINPHESEEVIKRKVLRAVVENRLPEGSYTPRLYGTTRGNITSLPPFFISWGDIRKEEQRMSGY